MKDKVDEFRKIINQKKNLEEQKRAQEQFASDSAEDISDETLSDIPHATTSSDPWQAKYEELQKASATQREMYLRQAAEFENSRKRLAKEQEDAIKFANERLLKDIFPVLDNLEMTLSHVPADSNTDPLIEGVRLTLKNFLQILEKNGLKEIGVPGSPFDPNLHEAIGTEASADHGPNHIVKVLRKGYTLNGRLIRAAMVVVSQ